MRTNLADILVCPGWLDKFRLKGTTSERHEIGENAHRKVTEELSWDNIAKKTIEVYGEAKNAGETSRETEVRRSSHQNDAS
jgi:glycosyltransferase involved in cell wall biosynthesis